jgi:hypothetical protein
MMRTFRVTENNFFVSVKDSIEIKLIAGLLSLGFVCLVQSRPQYAAAPDE